MELKVFNTFVSGIIERVLKKIIKNKLGIDADIIITQLEVRYEDDNAHVTLGAIADVGKDDITKLLKKVNI